MTTEINTFADFHVQSSFWNSEWELRRAAAQSICIVKYLKLAPPGWTTTLKCYLYVHISNQCLTIDRDHYSAGPLSSVVGENVLSPKSNWFRSVEYAIKRNNKLFYLN